MQALVLKFGHQYDRVCFLANQRLLHHVAQVEGSIDGVEILPTHKWEDLQRLINAHCLDVELGSDLMTITISPMLELVIVNGERGEQVYSVSPPCSSNGPQVGDALDLARAVAEAAGWKELEETNTEEDEATPEVVRVLRFQRRAS